jgi:hypothetical protein
MPETGAADVGKMSQQICCAVQHVRTILTAIVSMRVPGTLELQQEQVHFFSREPKPKYRVMLSCPCPRRIDRGTTEAIGVW